MSADVRRLLQNPSLKTPNATTERNNAARRLLAARKLAKSRRCSKCGQKR